jgi:hypothetical protein
MAAAPKNPILNLFKVNLLIQKDKQTKIYHRFYKWLLSSGRFIVIFVEILVVMALVARYKFDSDLTTLQENINRQAQYIKDLKNDEQLIKQTQLQLATVKKVKQENQKFPNAISEIARNTPLSIKLRSITLDQTQTSGVTSVTIIGQSPAAPELSAFIKALQESPNFKGITLTNMSSEGQIMFTVVGSLVNKGAV